MVAETNTQNSVLSTTTTTSFETYEQAKTYLDSKPDNISRSLHKIINEKSEYGIITPMKLMHLRCRTFYGTYDLDVNLDTDKGTYSNVTGEFAV